MFMTVRPPGVMYVGLQLGSQTNYLLGRTRFPVGEWTYLALVYDGPERRIGLFVNGEIDLELDVPPRLADGSQPSRRPLHRAQLRRGR